MLSNKILSTLKTYTTNMSCNVKFVVKKGLHEKKDELLEFLSDISSVSEKLSYEERDSDILRSPISFYLEMDDNNSGIYFSGIPSGHEFNSLILAVLQSSGTDLKLDKSIQTNIQKISDILHFEVYISLSCHNCPEVVQALNQFAIINPNISCEMIDGGLFQELIKKNDIQGVPSVYLNGNLFINGKVTVSDLIDKLSNFMHVDVLETSQLDLQDVVIIGGGPAGSSAAIYCARKGLNVTMIAERLGGQLKDTQGIENMISMSKTSGSELSNSLLDHMSHYDINIKEHIRVTNIINDEIKKVELSSGEIVNTKTIIISTGANWRELGVPGEKENIGNGVAYCPHCDGPFFKNKDVAVIGGGNSGIEAALDLSGIVNSVKVFEFLPESKADKVLIEQAFKKKNIEIITNTITKSITSHNGKVDGMIIENRESLVEKKILVNGIFIQIGLVPNSSFLGNLVDLTEYGEIIINDKCMTSEMGIFACGDVTTVPYKQIIVSMGEGSKAALGAFEYLLSESDRLDALYES